MKPLIFILLLQLMTASGFAQSEPCAQISPPVLSDSIKKDFEDKISIARADYIKDSVNADAIIWYGRRTAYLGRYMDALGIFTNGMLLHPDDPRLYRHRGHLYITVRCFDKAIRDLKTAARLIKNKKDVVEPDGLPNAKNIPTGTLQSNIWYHLGLAFYLKGQYKKAKNAYVNCLEVSKNPDMYVATANWLYITLRKLNKNKEATALLATIDPGVELIENKDYLEILKLYKNKPTIADPVNWLQQNRQGLSLASFGYGLGNYLLLADDQSKARRVFQHITASNQWAAFGFIAAEADLKRMK